MVSVREKVVAVISSGESYSCCIKSTLLLIASSSQEFLLLFLFITAGLFSITPAALADPYPPYWDNGTGAAIHFQPVPWPNDPADLKNCGNTCGDWKPYTRFQDSVDDPRTQDPSNGGTSPQNYVNVSSSCIDKTLPSIYYYLYKHPTDPTKDVIFFRWRVEQIANTYATGPNAGSYSSTDPWNSALWTVLFDLDGDGYIDLAAHLDGSSGAPATSIDRIFGIWSTAQTQSLDYVNDPDVKLIAHNPTAFIDPGTNRILNFHSALTPDANWPNGSAETSWDYGTTRSEVVTASPCNEYFIDYQIPVGMLDASSFGGPRITRDTPISMLFCTSNSLNNPFQKDCALRKAWIGDAARPAPFGDYLSFNQTNPYPQPIVSSVTATAPSMCSQGYALTAKVQDTIGIVNGSAVTSVKSVDFYYYYDANGNGITDDTGSSWTPAAHGALKPGTINTWTASWNATSLPKGKYLIGVQAVDTQYQDVNNNNQYDPGTDISLLDDGMTPTEAKNRTLSYLTQSEINTLQPWPVNETWYANPDITGTQMAVIGVALNNCGVAPTLTKTASSGSVVAGAPVSFTLTINNPTGGTITVSQITDALPAGFSYVNGSTSGDFGANNPSANGQTLTWNFGSPVSAAANGGSVSLTFSATSSAVTGTYSNTAAAATTFGSLSSNPVTVAVGAPRLTIAKAASATSFSRGDTITYTITYSNDSPVDVTGAIIADTLPDGISYIDGSASNGGSYDSPTRTISWNAGNLPSASGPQTVTFHVTVNDPYDGSVPLVNTASIISDQTPTPSTATSSSFVNAPYANMVLQKSSGSTLVSPGNDVTFTISYANNGTAAADNVVINDVAPAGFVFSSASPAPASSPVVGQSGTVSWNIGSVAAGASGSVTLTLQAGNPYTAADPQTNTAGMTWTGHNTPVIASSEVGVTQSGSLCSTYYFHQTTTDVGIGSDGGTQKTANVTSPASGTPATIAFHATTTPAFLASFFQDPPTPNDVNFSGNITTSFYVTKSSGPQLKMDVYVYDYDPGTGAETLLGSNSFTQTGSGTNQLFTFTLPLTGTLHKGHRILWKFNAYSNNNTDMVFNYDGTGSPSGANFCVTPPANLVIDKLVDRTAANTGDILTYTMKFSNTGQTAATGAQISDTLPSGVTCAGVSLNGSAIAGGCGSTYCTGQICTYSVNSSGAASGTVAAAASGTLVITAQISASLDPAIVSLTNSASLSSTQTLPVSDTTTTSIVGRGGGGAPSLSISKYADKTLLKPGDVVTYTLTVLNAGNEAANNVTVTDALPGSPLSYIAGSISGGDSRNVSGSLATWTVNSLAAGASSSLTFQMVAGSTSGVTALSNTASVTATGLGTTPSNTVIVSVSSNPNLNLTKAATPSSGLKPGDTVTYTLTLSNSGSGDAEGVEVVDPIPGGLNFNAITQGSGSFDAVNNRVIFNVGTLPSGALETLAFTATVNQLSPGITSINNTATVTASNASSRIASISVSASANPVLTLNKTAPAQVAYPAATLTAAANNAGTLFVNDTTHLLVGEYVSVGGTITRIVAITGNTVTLDTSTDALSGANVTSAITYILSYKNTGDAVAGNVILTDALPGGSTFVSATGGGIDSAGTVTWDIGNVDPGAGGTVQVVVMPEGAGTLTNSASIDCSGCPGPAIKAADTSVGGLIVTKKTSTPTTAAPGTATYVIKVDNTLSAAADGVTVNDTLPSGFSYNSTESILIDGNPVSPTTSPSSGDEFPAWGSFSIPGGKKLVLTFVANVDASVGAATYQNGAGSVSGNASVTPFDPLLTTAEDVTVLANNTGIVEGYVFQDNNTNGTFEPSVDTPLTGVTVNITDSTSTLYSISTDGSGYFSRVVSSGSATVDISDSDIPSGLTIEGAYFSDPAVVAVPDGGNVRTDAGYVLVSSTADVTTTADAPGSANAGSSVDVGITFSDNGPSTADEVTYSLTLPAGLTGVGCTGATCSYNSGTGAVTVSGLPSSLSSGQTENITLSYTAPASGSVTVTAGIGTNTSQGANAAPDTASGTTYITAIADVTTTLSAPGNVNAGSTVNVGITFSNNGPSTADGVTYSLTLPAGLTGVSCAGATCSYNSGTGAVTVSGLPSSLANSQTESITLSYTAPASGSVTVTAFINATTSQGTNTAPDTTNGSTSVSAVTDLFITKTASPDPVMAGQNVTYIVTIGNAGPSDAQSVVVTDTLPGAVTLVTAAGCTGTSVLTCDAGTIVAGGSRQYTITVTVNSAATGTLANTVTVTSGTPDPNMTNNTSSATTTVGAAADLQITKRGPAGVPAGQNIVYALDISNNGPGAANNVIVTDPLPAGTSFVSASGTGWACGEATGVVTCHMASLAVGSAPSIGVTVRAPAQPAYITNSASVSADTFDPLQANNAASISSTVSANTVHDVPAVTGWGILIFAILAGLAAACRLRKQKTPHSNRI